MSAIQWTDRTWNPVRGCSRVSEGCRNCYAEKIAARFSDVGKPFYGFADIGTRKGEARWTGKVALVPEKLDEPLRWRKPARVFVNSMSDLFHEKLPSRDIASVLAVITRTQRHTFQVLTKRPKRMLEYFTALAEKHGGYAFVLPNLWLGVSVEDQATADERIPLLLQTPAAVHFVSYEPALGPVDFHIYLSTDATEDCPACGSVMGCDHGALDWLIYGGESGPGARPNDVAWARSARDQCKAAGVAFFCKQLGAECISATPFGLPADARWAWRLENGERPPWYLQTRDPKGGDPTEWPRDLRVREFPR